MTTLPWHRQQDALGWYDKDAFNTHKDGEVLWAARRVLEKYCDALTNGYVEQFMPSFQEKLDPAYVEHAIQVLDARWAKENQFRGQGKYADSPDFSNRLAYAQKLALVEELRKALHRVGSSKGIMDSHIEF